MTFLLKLRRKVCRDADHLQPSESRDRPTPMGEKMLKSDHLSVKKSWTRDTDQGQPTPSRDPPRNPISTPSSARGLTIKADWKDFCGRRHFLLEKQTPVVRAFGFDQPSSFSLQRQRDVTLWPLIRGRTWDRPASSSPRLSTIKKLF